MCLRAQGAARWDCDQAVRLSLRLGLGLWEHAAADVLSPGLGGHAARPPGAKAEMPSECEWLRFPWLVGKQPARYSCS